MRKAFALSVLALALPLAACQPAGSSGAASSAEAARVIAGHGSVATAASAAPAPAYFQCGNTGVRFSPLPDGKGDMAIANSAYAMEQVPAASGAKYQNLGDASTVFWNKGDSAVVTVRGTVLPLCVPAAEPVAAKPDHPTWHLEDLNRAGVISNSGITLSMTPNGQLNGYAGCNSYSGRYTLEGEKLRINPAIVSTLRACMDEAMMRQEQVYLHTLPTMTRLQADASGALQLADDRGNTLTFKAAD